MIECVNRKHRLVIDDKGNQGFITHFMDENGDDCEPEMAVVCVAECAGLFYTINLQEYENVWDN